MKKGYIYAGLAVLVVGGIIFYVKDKKFTIKPAANVRGSGYSNYSNNVGYIKNAIRSSDLKKKDGDPCTMNNGTTGFVCKGGYCCQTISTL
tara:strand:+ start:20775 stop:21047 length:273 start_codon:yes stop_codon:yes gene_type:complete